MANLLEETIEYIKNSGHKIKDIVFIGSEESGYACSWNTFKNLANFEYDNGRGSQAIASDLVIVFSDGFKMWRHEYDGSECWQYHAPFTMPEKKRKITTLGGDHIMWKDLASLHGEKD